MSLARSEWGALHRLAMTCWLLDSWKRCWGRSPRAWDKEDQGLQKQRQKPHLLARSSHKGHLPQAAATSSTDDLSGCGTLVKKIENPGPVKSQLQSSVHRTLATKNMKRSLSHRQGKRASDDDAPSDLAGSENTSNTNENCPSEEASERTTRGHTKLRRPTNGQQIPIMPLEEAWQSICAYSCSTEYKKKLKLGQESRLKSNDIAQNRGGSRSYGQTKQHLANKYGPEAATDMNTYCCMKAGLKNCDSSGKSGQINNPKAQKRVDDYYEALEAEHQEDYEHDRNDGELDVQVLYKSGRGLPHGHLPIANGAVRKSKVIATARENDMRPANQMCRRDLLRRNAQLEQGVQISLILSKHIHFMTSLGWKYLQKLLKFKRCKQTFVCSQVSR